MSSTPVVPPVISFQNVTKRFPGVVALHDVSLDVAAGRIARHRRRERRRQEHADEVPLRRHHRLRGRAAAPRPAGPLPRHHATPNGAGISIIHQELNLVEQLSAAANIFLGREKLNRLRLARRPRDGARRRRTAASSWNATSDPRQLVRELRVGDQQLVEIAKALSLDADILIMDEPTSALTEAEVARLFRVIERLRDRGVTILYISHKMDEVFRLADRITVLRDGQLVRTLDRAATTTPREVTHLMVGREIEADRPRPPAHAGRGGARGREPLAPLAGPRPAVAAARHQLHAPPRRDPRHRRPDGRRAHRAAGMPVRRQRRSRRRARSCSTAAGVASAIRPRPCGRASPW